MSDSCGNLSNNVDTDFRTIQNSWRANQLSFIEREIKKHCNTQVWRDYNNH